jgi:DNA-binding CsgD family transcriptional regulator
MQANIFARELRLTAMESLAPKQAQIWELKRSGKTNKEIAAAVGCSENVVRKQLTSIYRKLGIKGGRDDLSKRSLTEIHRPEQAATLIDAATDPLGKYGKIAEAIRECGLPPSTGEAFLRRLRTRYAPVTREAKEFKTRDIVSRIDEKLEIAFEFMDEKVIGEASFRDLAMSSSALIEKRQLLIGEPTVVIDFNSRKKLNELLPAMLAEARRRGLAIEGEFVHVAAKDSGREDGGKG